MEAEQVLRTFAELSRDPDDVDTHVLRLEHDFEWVQPGALSLLRGETGSPASLSTSLLDGILERGEREPYVDRLIAAGELHRTEQLLRHDVSAAQNVAQF